MAGTPNFHFLMRDLTQEIDAGRITAIDAAMRTSEYIQKTLNCAHVSFWRFAGEGEQRVIRRFAGFDGIVGVPLTEPLEVPESGSGYFDTLAQAGCYICSDTFADPLLSGAMDSVLLPFNIHALLSASYGSNGEVWGVITCTDSVVRKWLPGEITALRKCAAEISVRRARRREREAAAGKVGFFEV